MTRQKKISLIFLSILILVVLSLMALISTKAQPYNPCTSYPYPYPYLQPYPGCNFMPVILKN